MPVNKKNDFFNLYHHGFIRAAVCIPDVKVADPAFNTKQTIDLAKKAAAHKAVFAIFPELGLSAYSNEDLFHQDAQDDGIGRFIAEGALAISSTRRLVDSSTPGPA